MGVAAVILRAALRLSGAPLEWTAPDECPEQQDVVARANRLAVVSEAALRGRAVVTRSSDGFAVEIEVAGRTQRHGAASCEALADLTALVVAVAADPVAVATHTAIPPASPPRDPTPPPTSAPAPEPPQETPSPSPTPRPALRRRWVPTLGVRGLVGYAQLPGIDSGAGISVALERPRLAVQVRADWIFARRTPIAGLAPAEAELAAGNVSLRGCGGMTRRILALSGCGGVELGAVWAHPVRVSESQDVTALWAAAIGAFSLRAWVDPRVGLELGGELVLALRRPRFALRDDPAATTDTRRGGIRGWAGILVRLGPLR